MNFDELEKKLNKKLNKNEWFQFDFSPYIQIEGDIHFNKKIFNEGGWIQNTTKIDESCRLTKDVIVYENVILNYDVYLYDSVQIFGNSKITGPISIFNNTKIYGDIEINPDILKQLNCYIDEYNDYIISGNFEIYDYKSLKSSISIMNLKNGI